MQAELNAMESNHTWSIVSLPGTRQALNWMQVGVQDQT